jgi:hypothetical protein
MDRKTNAAIADTLERIADLLEAQNANLFRVRAYREGAQTIRNADQSIADLAQNSGADALTAIPTIGSGIAAIVTDLVTTGKSDLLDELEAHVSPEAMIATVPGIGQALSQRVVEQLHIQTLPELEAAAHDGRLAEVEGFGARRVEGVRAALAGMLSRSAGSKQRSRADANQGQARNARPSVDLLLAVDDEYRRRAAAGELHKIAPKRFNPEGEAWLPVLNVKRDGWEFTALFSNTAQAHTAGKTSDWVVIYYERDGREQQQTVVTETKGTLKGKRVVRGREAENRQYYQTAIGKSDKGTRGTG